MGLSVFCFFSLFLLEEGALVLKPIEIRVDAVHGRDAVSRIASFGPPFFFCRRPTKRAADCGP